MRKTLEHSKSAMSGRMASQLVAGMTEGFSPLRLHVSGGRGETLVVEDSRLCLVQRSLFGLIALVVFGWIQR